MKPWVLIVASVVGGYFVYNWWFAPEEDPEDIAPRLLVAAEAEPEPVPEEPGAGSEEAEALSDSLRLPLDLEGGVPGVVVAPSRDDAARELDGKRREAQLAGDTVAAAELAGKILASHPESDAARLLRFEKGREALALYRRHGRNKTGLVHAHEARRHLTPALFLSDAAEEEKKRLRKTLAELADDVLFNPRHVEGVDFLYTPQRGDYLEKLCRKVFPAKGAKVSPGFILSVNRLSSPRQLRAGEPIKIPLGEISIVVVKSEYRLYLLLDGVYVKDFRVGLGKKGSTPEAAFKVRLKQKDPDWFPEPGKRIPFGDPNNILGTRWMGFENSSEYRGFGIHGTGDPASVGREESSGCVRMLQAEVEMLYDWVPVGTTVLIRR